MEARKAVVAVEEERTRLAAKLQSLEAEADAAKAALAALEVIPRPFFALLIWMICCRLGPPQLKIW